MDRKELQIWMTNYKLHVGFPLCQELVPLCTTLRVNCRDFSGSPVVKNCLAMQGTQV